MISSYPMYNSMKFSDIIVRSLTNSVFDPFEVDFCSYSVENVYMVAILQYSITSPLFLTNNEVRSFRIGTSPKDIVFSTCFKITASSSNSLGIILHVKDYSAYISVNMINGKYSIKKFNSVIPIADAYVMSYLNLTDFEAYYVGNIEVNSTLTKGVLMSFTETDSCNAYQ